MWQNLKKNINNAFFLKNENNHCFWSILQDNLGDPVPVKIRCHSSQSQIIKNNKNFVTDEINYYIKFKKIKFYWPSAKNSVIRHSQSLVPASQELS